MVTSNTLQYIMHDYRQRGFWIFTILLFIFSATQGVPIGYGTPPPHNSITSPLVLLREELVGTIKDLHTTGYTTDLEDSMADLVSQLENLQSVPGHPLQLEWENTGFNFTSNHSVCIVVSSFEGLYINSGIGTAYYALAELLARAGNKVTVLYTRDQPPTTGSFNDWVKHYEEKGIQLKSLPHSDKRIANPKLQVISAQVYQFLKLNHYDIVHFADFEGLGFYSTMAKRVGLDFANTLFVAGLHGPTRWVLDANEGRIPSHESELEVDWMERMSVENADVVWTPSNFLASWLSVEGWNLSSSAVHLLPLPPGPEVRGVKESVHVKAKELVFFGRLEKRKGLLLFCDAVDLLSKMHSVHKSLTITFLGTNGFVDGLDSIEYIRSRATKWNFTTKFITNATREAAIQYLMERKAGRIPVMPSLVDNAPYTVYECLYSGIPFLASATPSITPLLSKKEHHLFETKPHQLASRMVHSIKNGLSSAKSVFTSNDAEDAWMSFYSRLRLPQSASPVASDLPLVSVCLTHYNRPQFVQQALDSIEAQDYKKIEVILVDDGSNTTEAIAYLDSIQSTFDKNGWKIIRTANRYLGAARNTAAKNANGKYLLFLDDDNVAFPHQVSTYVTVAEKTKAHVVTAGHAVFKGVSAPTFDSIDRFWLPLGPSLAVGLFKNCFGDANFFVQKEAFNAIGGFTEEHSVGLEEHEFFAKAVFSGFNLEVIPEPLLYYRMHDESSQMVFTLDPRMGEARRIRPYLDALTPQSESDKAVKTRRSIVQLVARNAMDTQQDCNQTLSSVSPSSGPVNGGTTITVRGVGFSCGVQALRIDGQACTGLHVVSNFEITCQTPAGSRTYTAVDITADVGGDTIALYSAFTYLPSSAPVLDNCRLSNDGLSINCAFDSNTNQASGSCSTFFASETISTLGSGANCYWTSATVLSIDLGQGATIAIGSTISVLAGSVKAQGTTDVANEAATTPLLAPLNAGAPIASISSPSSVGSCEGITLKASSSTGGLGRSLTYTWALVSIEPASSDSETAINAAISEANSANSDTVTIAAENVAVAAYTFSLTVESWIGGNATSTATVTKSTSSVPTVSISGPSVVSIFKNDALSLTGEVASSCGAELGSVTYAWSVTPSVSLGSSASSATLTVPENTFTAGTSYTVTLTVSDNGLENSASVTVSVGVRELVVSILGGNKQYQNTETVTLDGSASNDPEGLENFAFAWSCVSYYDSNNPCSVSAPTSSVFSFDASAIGVGKYSVTLTVTGSLNRKATATVWVEVLEVSVLSISIEALKENPVDPTSSLTLTGVLNQAGVSLAEVTWSWSLTGGSLANPDSAYLSGLDGINLVIAANALTPGASYSYKLTATQTATGVSGTATISFSVDKAPTTGEFGCAVTSGTAEETDFTYDFGTMWGSSSGISSYEIRFVPEGSTIEIPLGEPSSATTFTTKLPYGKYTVIGIAHSGNGVSARKECGADVTYSDVSSGLSALASKASISNLSAFEIARIAYGAKAAFSQVGSSGSSNYNSIRSSLISAIQGTTSSVTTNSATANTASFLVLTDSSTGILSQSSLISAINAFGSLLDAQASVSVDTTVLAADVEILSNLVDQLSNQDFDVRVLVKRADEDLWEAFDSLIIISSKVASQYLAGMSSGQNQITIAKSLLTLSLYAGATSQLTGNGVTIGSGATVKLPSGFVPSGVSANNLALSLSAWGVSPYPNSAGVVSPVLILGVTGDGSSVNLNDLPSPASVFVPNSELLDSNDLECVSWDSSAANWTTESCTTAQSDSGVTCSCDSATGAFAVSKSASSRAQVGDDDNGGLSPAIIGVIAGVGGLALIAVVVGSVIGVKRHRARQGGNATAAAAGPSAAAPEPAPLSSDAVPVAVAAGAAGAAAAPGTPASVAGSYSSASSRSIVSSSSSEEEVMEQQIKDIVGELSTALPRDPRALEVLGDRLDME